MAHDGSAPRDDHTAELARIQELLAEGRDGEAADALSRILDDDPAQVDALYGLGTLRHRGGRLDEAVPLYRRAVALRADFPEALNNLGVALGRLGDDRAAEASLRACLAASPHFAGAETNLGNVLFRLWRFDEAEAAHRRALALEPGLAAAHKNLGDVLVHLDRIEEAEAAVDAALRLAPEELDILASRALLAYTTCDWATVARIEPLLRARLNRRLSEGGPSPLSKVVTLCLARTPAELLEINASLARAIAARSGPPTAPPTPPAADRLHVGYLSSGFFDQATTQLLGGLFARHDRSRFRVTAYSTGPDDGSGPRRRVRDAAEAFVDLVGAPTEAIVERIRADGVQILVDVKGYAVNSRLEPFALRAGPVQVTWLAYPGTLGAAFFDYLVADPTVVPAGDERFYAEQVVRLPDCYQVNDDRQPIADRPSRREECGLPAGAFVFCCLNEAWKIGPAEFDAWMRLLRERPDAVLWLRASNAPAVRRLRDEARRREVDPERLVFAPLLPRDQHLARYRLADLSLDTFQVNGHATATDALWAGLPVVTTPGRTFASRVAASLLRAVGLPELVAPDREAYAALALRLAREPETLAGLRRRLAEHRRTRPLFDGARLTRHLEAAYQTMWAIHQRGESPRSFVVPASA